MAETTTEALKYTREKPTEPGWYWVKNRTSKPKIYRVIQDPHGHMLAFIQGITYALGEDDDMLFAGPIPEPE